MAYSDKVLDHYENPRNVGAFDKGDDAVGTGMVGAPACGDVMKLQIKVNEQGLIEDAKFKTYGCGSAIASSSLVTEWVKGKTLDQALAIKNTQIAEELALPPVKIHCSILAEDAIKAAGAEVRVHDPRALPVARVQRPGPDYVDTVAEALEGADVVLHLTEWQAYRELDADQLRSAVHRPVIIDGRNKLDPALWRAAGWTYRALGRPTI